MAEALVMGLIAASGMLGTARRSLLQTVFGVTQDEYPFLLKFLTSASACVFRSELWSVQP